MDVNTDSTRAARRVTVILVVLMGWAVLAGADAASEPPGAFRQPIEVERTPGGGCEVSLTLTRPTDVTIRILGASGTVVRRLASGMVGLERAAAPLAPGSLLQKIRWDGKDDRGQPVPPGEYRVQVGTGIRAKFGRFILGNPDGFGVFGAPNWAYPGSIAVGPNGEVYLVQQYGVHYSTLRVFDREGRFVRCVWPLSLDKPKEEVEPFLASTMTIWPADVAPWTATDWAGRVVPRSVSHSAFYWYGVRSNAMVVTPEGRIVISDCHTTSSPQLLVIAPNGLPEKTAFNASWQGKTARAGLWDLAVGPGGDVYLSDKDYGVVAHLDKGLRPVPSFTCQADQREEPPSFLLGRPKVLKAGVWDPLLALTVDGQDRIWVADPPQDRIQVFSKDGRLLATLDRVLIGQTEQKINAKELALAANFKSEAVYLNIRAGKERCLVKLKSPDCLEAVAHITLPSAAKRLAVDSEADLIWVLVGQDTLLRIADLGAKFEVRTIRGLEDRTLAFPRSMSLDAQGRLCLTDAASAYVLSDVDGKTLRRLSWYGVGGHGYSAPDGEGNWYVLFTTRFNRGEVWKLSADGKRLPIGAQESIVLDGVKEPKGICLAPSGDLYIAVTVPIDADKQKTLSRVFGSVDVRGDEYNFSRVDVYGPDGTLKKRGLVSLQGVNDVKLDRQGNVYVLEAGLCHGAHKRRAARLDNKAFTQFSKLLKFAADGGVRDGPGHLWTYGGLSGVSSYTCAGECPAGQMAVDADDRVWICDPALYNVAAVDGAGNLMCRIGAYGNEDCRGGGGDETIAGTKIVRSPEIPLARPFGVAVWKDDLLIADMYAHRVLRCELQFSEEKVLELTMPPATPP